MTTWKKWNYALKTAIAIVAIALISISVTACSRSVGEALPEEEYLTNKALAIYVVEDLWGYDIRSNVSCGHLFPDVEADTPLCRAIQILQDHDQGLGIGYQNGRFEPDSLVNWAETWKTIVVALGFAPYNDSCIEDLQDVDAESWYAAYAGSLCSKVIIPLNDQTPILPGFQIPLEDWDVFKGQLESALDEDANRIFSLEILAMTFLSEEVDIPRDIVCSHLSPDVPDYSLDCQLIEELVELDYLEPDPNGWFRPEDGVNWAEIYKLTVVAANLEAGENGCYTDGDPGTWYLSYLEPFCEDSPSYIDVDDPEFDPASRMSRLELIRFSLDVSMERPRYILE